MAHLTVFVFPFYKTVIVMHFIMLSGPCTKVTRCLVGWAKCSLAFKKVIKQPLVIICGLRPQNYYKITGIHQEFELLESRLMPLRTFQIKILCFVHFDTPYLHSFLISPQRFAFCLEVIIIMIMRSLGVKTRGHFLQWPKQEVLKYLATHLLVMIVVRNLI